MNFYPAIISNFLQSDQKYSALEPIAVDKPPYDEDWLQNLIHNHPELVPAAQVEACFDNLVPILREFPLPSGYLDNLYVTPEGYPVLVEVKLWKNQEARRKVVAQILEYAKDFAALGYEDLNIEIRKQLKTRKWGDNPLHEMVSEAVANPPQEADFVDRISRNLREGRFLLLILGDGIREEMAALADYLMHHSLRYAFGMVEIKFFKLPSGETLALPRVLSKTQAIERHVTVVTTQAGEISLRAEVPVISERLEKTSLSMDEFFGLVGQHNSANVGWLKDLLDKISNLPIEVQMGAKGETLMLKTPAGNAGQVQLMLITPTTAQFWGVPNKHWKDPVWQRLARSYIEQVSSLIPGSAIKEFGSGLDIKYEGKYLPLSFMHNKTDALIAAFQQVMRDIENYTHTDETITL